MDLQFYGANCVTISLKGARVVIDDNLADLGGKGITKADDVTLFTSIHGESKGRLSLDSPGEYEVSDISIYGISARAHIDEPGKHNATMFKLIVGELSILVTGHIYPQLSDKQLEAIGMVDVMIVPVGGNGYTVDPIGALKLIKSIEPKLVIPTHYADASLNFAVPQQDLAHALTELGMEASDTVSKLKIKHSELPEVTALTVLEKS
jgi:L-ascorbate metabolism protein UlaG (beta-lactamase superfamily)